MSTYTVTFEQLQKLHRLGSRVREISNIVEGIDEEIGELITEIAKVETLPDEQRDEFWSVLVP